MPLKCVICRKVNAKEEERRRDSNRKVDAADPENLMSKCQEAAAQNGRPPDAFLLAIGNSGLGRRMSTTAILESTPNPKVPLSPARDAVLPNCALAQRAESRNRPRLQ